MTEEAASLLIACVVVGDVMLAVIMILMVASHLRAREVHGAKDEEEGQ